MALSLLKIIQVCTCFVWRAAAKWVGKNIKGKTRSSPEIMGIIGQADGLHLDLAHYGCKHWGITGNPKVTIVFRDCVTTRDARGSRLLDIAIAARPGSLVTTQGLRRDLTFRRMEFPCDLTINTK
jgi:hypothetical protein